MRCCAVFVAVAAVLAGCSGGGAGVAVDADADVDADVAGGEVDSEAEDGDASGCAVVACGLTCRFGFVRGEDGCETCACRACAEANDCAASGCPSPMCGEDGACGCDCDAVPAGTRYACPGGDEVARCGCVAGAWTCDATPERGCPTVCEPGQGERWPCPDGEGLPWCTCAAEEGCAPRCEHVGEPEEGYYDGCTGALVKAVACGGCVPACGAIGTRNEGYYDCADRLIARTVCGPTRTCDSAPEAHCEDLGCALGQTATYPCPSGGEVVMCACEAPGAACAPECRHAGEAEEGYYDGCTGALVEKRACAGCAVSCDAVGSKSEGWYDDCGGLIAWAACGTGVWTCLPEPWRRCDLP